MMATSWLTTCVAELSSTKPTQETCKALHTIMSQVKTQPKLASEILDFFQPTETKLLQHLTRADNEDFIISAVQCMDETLIALSDAELSLTHLETLDAIGNALLHLHYVSSKNLSSFNNNTLLLLSSLSVLNKIMIRCPNFVQTHISELLGLSKVNANFGLDTVTVTTPRKVLPSQNLPYDSSTEELECENAQIEAKARRSGSGRVPKKRKPRALAKLMQASHQNQQNQSIQRFQTLTFDQIIASDIKTSDSDGSELENSVVESKFSRNFSALERQKHAKVRQMALSLLGTIVIRMQERRLLYRYWHAFFENTKFSNNDVQKERRNDLLYIGLHDPNSKCRLTALQIAAQLIFSSKNFLQQAEYVVERHPKSFLPFAYNLGLHVVSMFEELTMVLITESSLLVLIQALKCLAVLVQATTPFRKFQQRDFVGAFVKEVQRLAVHRDETLQVAALMVLEFLISTTDLTSEILTAIGAPSHIHKDHNQLYFNDDKELSLDEFSNNIDENIESDCEDNTFITCKDIDKNKERSRIDNEFHTSKKETSWLLQYVLRNLDAETTVCPTNSTIVVRIESLQVLAAMAPHFTLLESHLDKIVIAIRKALLDPQSDLRLCAARSLDTIVFEIGRNILENTPETLKTTRSCFLLEESLNFWNKILPIIMDQIGMTAESMTTSIKVCLCDVLSNIGVVIFERQPYAVQMNLISFLSGIGCDLNEDVTVRCAAIRALAVYSMFPSLRENLVFIENAAELTLRLIGDTNVLVRVKASWALGNISDALLLNNTNTMDNVQISERISDDLFWRMIKAGSDACSGNDKIRCNAVRILGNLLRLLKPLNLINENNINNNCSLFQSAITKLLDCLRSNASAKVKWNTCYAIGNLLQNSNLFSCAQINSKDFDWQSKLYTALTNVIVHHPNFKVRINAATALTRINERIYFGIHYEEIWRALLKAIEQSHHLDNFYEYNHRDQLQEQLCLALSHMMSLAQPEDFIILYKHLAECREIVSNTWKRVLNRMVPEKSAPLIGCTAFLQQQLKATDRVLTIEQRNAIAIIMPIFETQ